MIAGHRLMRTNQTLRLSMGLVILTLGVVLLVFESSLANPDGRRTALERVATAGPIADEAIATAVATRLALTEWDVPVVPVGEMGPSGRWPSGFASYASAASVVTDGSMSGLLKALDSLPNGGVIEHAGGISGTLRRASGSAPVVIRPPLGRRDEFRLGAVDVWSSGILLAGFRQTSKVHVHDSVNSGVAWTVMDQGAEVRGMGYTPGVKTHVLMYEVVAPTPGALGGDRVVAHAQAPGAVTNIDIVGSWLSGTNNSPVGDHADTVQTVFLSGGTGFVTIDSSVIWPSDDKALQGAASVPVYRLVNSWIASPSAARAVWPALNIRGYHAITAVAEVEGSVLAGTVHRGFAVRVRNSTVSRTDGTIVDAGGNTTVSAVPAPPPSPTNARLDTIWHN